MIQSTTTVALPPPAPEREVATEIVVQGRVHETANDPLEETNLKSFELTEKVDDALTRPIALAYKKNLPPPVRDGLRNFLHNLSEPIVFANFVLQLKPGKAGETAARFLINSTVGVAGLVDVAKRKPVNLPHRINGLAYTLGYYGVKPGPFLYVPLIGPTTARDLVGVIADRIMLPFLFGAPFTQPAYTIPVGTVATLDRRAEFDDELEAIRATVDPYQARRDYYLRSRQRQIDELRGKSVPQPTVTVLTIAEKDALPK